MRMTNDECFILDKTQVLPVLNFIGSFMVKREIGKYVYCSHVMIIIVLIGVWRGSLGITLSNYDNVSSYIPINLGKLFTLNASFQPLFQRS